MGLLKIIGLNISLNRDVLVLESAAMMLIKNQQPMQATSSVFQRFGF